MLVIYPYTIFINQCVFVVAPLLEQNDYMIIYSSHCLGRKFSSTFQESTVAGNYCIIPLQRWTGKIPLHRWRALSLIIILCR